MPYEVYLDWLQDAGWNVDELRCYDEVFIPIHTNEVGYYIYGSAEALNYNTELYWGSGETNGLDCYFGDSDMQGIYSWRPENFNYFDY